VRAKLGYTVGVGGDHKLPVPQTHQVIGAHPAVDALVIHRPVLPVKFSRDPSPAVAGKFQGHALDGIPQGHLRLRLRPGRAITVKPRPAHSGQPTHAFHRQAFVPLLLGLDLRVDSGLPFKACSFRCSSMRCKHPFKKSISSAC
jgi:hypothetical protein